MSNLKYWLWLAGRKGIAGNIGIRVLSHFGSPERVYFSDPEEYKLVGGLSASALNSLADKSLDGANRILGDCDRLGIHILTMQDSAYPERLAAIHQPPMVLYWKGRPVAFDEEAAIAIVGTRDATAYGTWAAAKLSMDLTKAGALIVSGMAQGIDAAAIRGALSAGGPVVSVLAGGIDVVYPREHRALYEDVGHVGTLISEHPPGTDHRGSHFPVRNRIISGLSVGVIAVESKRYGGTLHTISHALEQNREVFAVPGPIGAECSEGTNQLIQEGAAKLILDSNDVLCEFVNLFPKRLSRGSKMEAEAEKQRLAEVIHVVNSKETQAEPVSETQPEAEVSQNVVDWQLLRKNLSDDQEKIMLALETKALRADDLVELTQLPTRRVLSALTMLQIQELVVEESGKRFRSAVRLKME